LSSPARHRLDAAYVSTYDTLDDRQPHAGSLLASVATFDAVEHIEDTPSFFLWNARPAIRDVDLHLIVLCPSNLHLERHPRRGELRRVLHDVEQSLLDERGVDMDRRQVRWNVVLDAGIGLVPLQAPGRRAHQLVDADPVARQRQSLLPEPGHV